MAESTFNPLRPLLLPAIYPRTATHLLIARGGDPFAETRRLLASARRTVGELLEFLPAEQTDLRSRFADVLSMLTTCGNVAQGWGFVADELQKVQRHAPPPWGEANVLDGAPVGSEPVPADHQDDPVYGFRPALRAAKDYLRTTTEAAVAFRGPNLNNLHALYLAATMAHAATMIDRLAAVFTAAAWDFERPAMPQLPSGSGRIELRAGPRAIPQTRWARYARVMFLSNRVELTTSEGHEVIGSERPIAFLLHVVPAAPTSAVLRADPAERYTDIPLYDELGLIHFCDDTGRSMGAIAVADWLAQPEITVAQPASTHTGPRNLHQHGRLVWSLQASGIVAGAAVLGVGIRRAVAHPPPSHDPQETASPVLADPRPLARVIRPGPQLQPHRGLAARRKSASRRRTRNRIAVGPASLLQPALQYLAIPAIIVGGLGLAVANRPGWIVQSAVVIALLAVLEPWLVFAGEWLRDRDWRKMVAVYRPGRGPGSSRQFAQRAALLFDGSNIGARGADGHEAWVAASSDADLGVTTVLRLIDDGRAWAFAFADRLGRWRLVLPASTWAPDGDLNGLAGFAQSSGLSVADANATPFTRSVDPFDATGTERLRRSRGPATRAMVWLAGSAGITLLLTLFSSFTAAVFLLAIAVLAVGPVIVRAVVVRWLNQSSVVSQDAAASKPLIPAAV